MRSALAVGQTCRVAPQIQDLRPQVDLRVDVGLDADALWDRLIRIVPDGRHVQIARSGPRHIVCEVLGRRGRVVGEFQITWEHVHTGSMHVRSTQLARLAPSKLSGSAKRDQALVDEHYRATITRVSDALRNALVPSPESVRQPVVDPELVRRVATTFAPPPPAAGPDHVGPEHPDVEDLGAGDNDGRQSSATISEPTTR